MRLTCITLLQLCSLSIANSVAAGLSILDAHGEAAGFDDSYRKYGDGPGRPLYTLNTIEMPENLTGKACITLRFDLKSHSLSVDVGEKDPNFVATACYNDAIERTGWSTLKVVTTDSPGVPLAVRAFGAGFVEGLLTHQRISQFSSNVKLLLAKDLAMDEALRLTVERRLRYALLAWERMSGGDATIVPDGDLPKQAWAALLQMRGIRDGHNVMAGATQSGFVTAYDCMLLNMHAELSSLTGLYGRSQATELLRLQLGSHDSALLQTSATRSSKLRGASTAQDGEASQRAQPSSAMDNDWVLWTAHKPRGTAFVRRVGPKGGPDDLLSGHVTFANYGEAVRVMKHYHLNFDTLVTDISMSSYPGCISSTDDYFVTNKGFALMSTTLYIPSSGNFSIPSASAEGLPAFLRATIATRLASLPRTWAKVYGYLPGLAATKQWLLVDYSKLKEQQPLGNDTVWLVESLPRLQRSGDVTDYLRTHGYFTAQGQPFFRQIRELFGFSEFAPSSYELHHQSSLVDKASTINSLSNAREVLTELVSSRGTKQASITARYDLLKKNAIPAGGIDAKVTGKCLVQRLGFQGKSGPAATQGASPFTWLTPSAEELWPGWPHDGVPDVLDFDWASISGDGTITYPLDPSMSACEPASANDPEAAINAAAS
mmetsp:Transcript_68678/g.128125  ORF Transcript_68678/g.128125 Transcript_68678/m.128125 type:complete len:658 (-) Transcript_68678:55-2028(-)